MSDSDNHGRQLERLFHTHLLNTVVNHTDVIGVYYENELMKRYGWDASSVDYMIELKDQIIVIQTKYIKSRRRENQAIKNFLSSAHHVSRCMQKPIKFGMWISRLQPFADNIDFLKTKQIFCVSYFEEMDTLVKNAISLLNNKLAFG